MQKSPNPNSNVKNPHPNRQSREIALQILFQIELNPNVDYRSSLDSLRDQLGFDRSVYNYSFELIEGVQKNIKDLDEKIQNISKNWKLERMSHVDRNILRLSTFEILFKNSEIPKNVSINEAIELAKKFGSSESSHFVNGLLDQVSKKL